MFSKLPAFLPLCALLLMPFHSSSMEEGQEKHIINDSLTSLISNQEESASCDKPQMSQKDLATMNSVSATMPTQQTDS